MKAIRPTRYLKAASERSRYYLAKMQRRPVINLLHIGKTGGNAVKTALAGAPPPDKVLVRLRPHRVRLSDVPQGEKVVFFLREPGSRFVSGFNTRQRQGRPRFDSPWSPAEQIAFSRFRSADDLAVSLSSTDQDVRHAAEDAMRSIQHVRDSFYYWFISDDYFRSRLDDIILIGFQETLEADFDSLKCIIGLQKDVVLPSDEIVAHRSPSRQATTLSAEAKANLSHWYSKDLDFYAWCEEIAVTQLPRTGSPEDRLRILQRSVGAASQLSMPK
jgi:hypothetical protein